MGSIFITQVASLINFWSAARKLPITFVDEIKDNKEIGLKKSSYKSKTSVIWSYSKFALNLHLQPRENYLE